MKKIIYKQYKLMPFPGNAPFKFLAFHGLVGAVKTALI